jgi:hypothetical protein
MRQRMAIIVGLGLLLIMLLSVTALSVSAATCPVGPAPRLVVGDVARPAQLYSSLRADFESNVIFATMYRAYGDQFRVIEGPRCGTYHVWYKVEYNRRTGWVTEGEGSTYWIEKVGASGPTPTPPSPTPTPPPPVCTAGPAPRLIVGGNARPAQYYSSLRDRLGSNVVIAVMYRASGDQFRVLEGPYCSGAHYWWAVDFKGQTGYVTEGMGSTYWVERVP